MFSFTRFCLRVLADLNEIIRRMKRKVILTIAIIFEITDVKPTILGDSPPRQDIKTQKPQQNISRVV